MIRITVVFYGMLYGKQVSEWTCNPADCEKVSSTINYLISSGMKKIVSINIKQI